MQSKKFKSKENKVEISDVEGIVMIGVKIVVLVSVWIT